MIYLSSIEISGAGHQHTSDRERAAPLAAHYLSLQRHSELC